MEYKEKSDEELTQINALGDICFLVGKLSENGASFFETKKDFIAYNDISVRIKKEPNGSRSFRVSLSHPDLDAKAMEKPMIGEGYVPIDSERYGLYLNPEKRVILPHTVNIIDRYNGNKYPQIEFITTLDKKSITKQVELFLEALISNLKK